MRLALASLLVSLGTATLAVAADQGIAPDRVTFAQVAVLEGPAAPLGTGMQLGLRAAFEEANRAGGVHGRQIALDSLDDGYEPEQSVAQVRSVIAGNAHIGFVGPVGTPTTQATVPIAAEAMMPVIGPFTGAGFLRAEGSGNVFNVRASYDAETEAWMRTLVDEMGMSRIAILYQDDGFGRVGLAGATAALERRGMTLVAEASYTRNTVAVKSALIEIRKSEAEAVVMVGAPQPVAEFVRLSRQIGFDPTFVNISFVGTDALVSELGADGAGVIISQVVPYPRDETLPAAAAYRAALAAVDPAAQPGYVSFEGYLTGRLAIEALRAAGPDLTREGYMAALRGLGTVEVDGLTMTFGPGDNQAFDDVYMTVISPAGAIEPLGNS
jgi:branched-chain amino acid transport system substrate-binding protein